MLDPRQDQTLQDLARSIANSVDALGGTCTAGLLASIALGLVDSPGSDDPTTSTSSAEGASKPASKPAGEQTTSHVVRESDCDATYMRA